MTVKRMLILLLALVLIAKGMSWIVVTGACLWAAFWLLRELRMWLFVAGQKGIKDRMEALLLVRRYRASRRR